MLHYDSNNFLEELMINYFTLNKKTDYSDKIDSFTSILNNLLLDTDNIIKTINDLNTELITSLSHRYMGTLEISELPTSELTIKEVTNLLIGLDDIPLDVISDPTGARQPEANKLIKKYIKYIQLFVYDSDIPYYIFLSPNNIIVKHEF